MTELTFTNGATITFRDGPSETFVDSLSEVQFDRDGHITEVRSGTLVGRYTGPRSKETLPDNWEPEEWNEAFGC